MKKLLLLLLPLFAIYAYPQNLVNNFSGEDTLRCPLGNGDVRGSATGWNEINSADYFNSCHDYTFSTDVPNNFFGYQCPANGNAYFGLYTATTGINYANREYLFTTLSSPLMIGQKYFTSFKVSASDYQECYTNNIGLLFSTVLLTDTIIIPAPFINNFAHVYTNTVITDTANWTTIRGSFIADSAYEYLYVGNFFSDTLTDTICRVSNPNPSAYYFIDDVCISTDSLKCEVSNGSNFCDSMNAIIEQKLENHFVIFPSPAKEKIIVKANQILNEEIKIEIYDMLGRKCYSYQLKNGENEIDCSSFIKGIYVIKIFSNTKKMVQKISLIN